MGAAQACLAEGQCPFEDGYGEEDGSSLPTGHALCEWSKVTVSPGQQLKDAGSVSLNGGRVQSGFELSLNLPKVETV